MKKLILLLSFFLLQSAFCNAQNLVPNPSFEIMDTCPNNAGQIRFVPPWFQPGLHIIQGASIFSSCANSSNPAYGVPRNTFGYQQARTGNKYGVFIAYGGGEEYIEAPLLDELKADKTYCVDFYLSLTYSSAWAIDAIGAYFSTDSLIDHSVVPPGYGSNKIILNPTISNPKGNIISDTMNWVEISAKFIAHGGEKFITIGDFINDDSVTVITVDSLEWGYTIYYIDDISVYYCGGDSSGINEIEGINNLVSLYPNPATDNLTIEAPQQATIEITNIQGQVIKQQTTNTETTNINISALAKGMYFVKVKTERGVAVKKFIKE